MINNLLKKITTFFICFLILTLYFGFFLDENITLGPKSDLNSP